MGFALSSGYRQEPSLCRGRDGPPEASEDVMMFEGNSLMLEDAQSPTTWEVRLGLCSPHQGPEGGQGTGAAEG